MFVPAAKSVQGAIEHRFGSPGQVGKDIGAEGVCPEPDETISAVLHRAQHGRKSTKRFKTGKNPIRRQIRHVGSHQQRPLDAA